MIKRTAGSAFFVGIYVQFQLLYVLSNDGIKLPADGKLKNVQTFIAMSKSL